MIDRNQIQKAFFEPLNLTGLSVVLALGVVTKSPVVMVGLIPEAIYLGTVANSKWYLGVLSKRYNREVTARREKLKLEVGPTLPPTVLARFARLETTRRQIGGQAFASTKWFLQVLQKLDYLMEKFLLFASKQVQFQTYLSSILNESDAPATTPPLSSTTPKKLSGKPTTSEADEEWVQSTVAAIQLRYHAELDGIDSQRSKEENLHNQAILDKRREVLDRRSQYVSQIGEILSNLNHQLQLMEDTFGLINDEIHARSPEQVLADIDDVANRTDSLTEMLRVVSPFEQMPVAPGAAKLYDVPKTK